jgi:hypothetical protein
MPGRYKRFAVIGHEGYLRVDPFQKIIVVGLSKEGL